MLETVFESHFGKKLRVARVGNGPALILLHGYPDTLQIWHRLAPRLGASFEVIAFDWPGMGYSECWPGGATPYHLADRLSTLLDRWSIARAVIVGMDMGGQPAIAMAACRPDQVHSVVVMNSLLQWDAKTSWEIAFLRRLGWNRLALRHFPRVVFNRAVKTFLPAGAHLAEDLKADMWNSFSQRTVRDFIVRMCAGYQGSLRGFARAYAALKVPALLLWAEHEKHFPIQHAQCVQDVAVSARIQIVDGAEHWMPLSVPDAVANYILDFTRERT